MQTGPSLEVSDADWCPSVLQRLHKTGSRQFRKIMDCKQIGMVRVILPKVALKICLQGSRKIKQQWHLKLKTNIFSNVNFHDAEFISSDVQESMELMNSAMTHKKCTLG